MSDYQGQMKEDIAAAVLGHGVPRHPARDWYYGTSHPDYDLAIHVWKDECSWHMTSQSEIEVVEYISFAGTFAESDTPSTMIVVDKAACACGRYEDVLIGWDTTIGELMQSIFSGVMKM